MDLGLFSIFVPRAMEPITATWAFQDNIIAIITTLYCARPDSSPPSPLYTGIFLTSFAVPRSASTTRRKLSPRSTWVGISISEGGPIRANDNQFIANFFFIRPFARID